MATDSFEVDEEHQTSRTVFAVEAIVGAVLVLFSHGIWIPLASLLGSVQAEASVAVMVGMWFIGVTQLVYVMPYLALSVYLGKRGATVGIVLMATVTFLLNAACFGLIAVVGLGIG